MINNVRTFDFLRTLPFLNLIFKKKCKKWHLLVFVLISTGNTWVSFYFYWGWVRITLANHFRFSSPNVSCLSMCNEPLSKSGKCESPNVAIQLLAHSKPFLKNCSTIKGTRTAIPPYQRLLKIQFFLVLSVIWILCIYLGKPQKQQVKLLCASPLELTFRAFLSTDLLPKAFPA